MTKKMKKSNDIEKNVNANQMWGGHFTSGPAEIMEKINASIDFDKILYSQDITGSLAHCKMLKQQNILTSDEADKISEGLKQIKEEIEKGEFEFKNSLEDIHMNIESRLKEIIGDIAGKLHTARSRNDQVATDFKLYVRDSIDLIDEDLRLLQDALLNLAEENADTIMPGFTHLQTAQPITFGHHLLAYVEMFGRDRSRYSDTRDRLNECPLGSAALAGTPFNTDRYLVAEELGFDRPTSNSLDSVSDRDFALDILYSSSVCATHISRIAEEIVFWCSDGFKFISLSNAFTTGSSIMPQKRNPDAAELARAKTGRINGSLISLLTVMKGLPLAYSKDMQEDKEPVFETVDSIRLIIQALSGMINDISVNKENMLAAANKGYSTATDIADWLVMNLGLPFRECHHITGRIVKLAEEKKCRLDELSLSDMQTVKQEITENIFDILSVEKSVMSRKSFGGTSPDNVRESIIISREKYI